jgi:translation elongation factor EF-4
MRLIAAKPMKPNIKYQGDDNAAYIRLSGGDILESSEVTPNVVFDYDVDKKKMRQFGKVDIPQETFIAALKVDS